MGWEMGMRYNWIGWGWGWDGGWGWVGGWGWDWMGWDWMRWDGMTWDGMGQDWDAMGLDWIGLGWVGLGGMVWDWIGLGWVGWYGMGCPHHVPFPSQTPITNARKIVDRPIADDIGNVEASPPLHIIQPEPQHNVIVCKIRSTFNHGDRNPADGSQADGSLAGGPRAKTTAFRHRCH